jgi:hypothetical protein
MCRLSYGNSLARQHVTATVGEEHTANGCTVCTADSKGHDNREVSLHCRTATHFITTATKFHLATE